MKKYLLGLFAVVLAVGFTAFTADKHEVKSTNSMFVDVWYEYVGPIPATAADLANAANYVKFVPQPADIKVQCPSKRDLCAVKFPDNGTNPLPADVAAKQTEIQTALSTQTETATIELILPL